MDAVVHVNTVLSSAIARLLRPIVRILLANGLSYDAFADIAKRTYVEIGMREFAIAGKKQSISRISILTGLSRKEVQRVLQDQTPLEATTNEHYNRAARVIAGWIRDSDFTEANRQPKALPVDGAPASFSELVRRYSGDMPARAVLDELLRVGAVERLGDQRIQLVARAYVPRKSGLDKLGILGTDVADLIHTIDHNLELGPTEPYFQRKVMYDNLPSEALPEFRALTADRAQELLEHLDTWLAGRDRDVNPDINGTGRMRAGVGIYYFQEDLQASPVEK